jgi:hypothetical protein
MFTPSFHNSADTPKKKGQLYTQIKFQLLLSLCRPEFIQLPARVWACILKDRNTTDFSKQPTSCKTVMEPMTGNVTTSEVNVYVALRTAEEQVPYGK